MIGPIIFGAQRFSVTSSLSVGTSNVQASVGSSMAWAAGEMPLFSPASSLDDETDGAEGGSGARRRLRQLRRRLSILPRDTPPEFVSLLNTLITAAVAIAIVLAIQFVVIGLWKFYLNRGYYRQQE